MCFQVLPKRSDSMDGSCNESGSEFETIGLVHLHLRWPRDLNQLDQAQNNCGSLSCSHFLTSELSRKSAIIFGDDKMTITTNNNVPLCSYKAAYNVHMGFSHRCYISCLHNLWCTLRNTYTAKTKTNSIFYAAIMHMYMSNRNMLLESSPFI